LPRFRSRTQPFIFLILPLILAGIIALLIIFVNQSLYDLFINLIPIYGLASIAWGLYPLCLKTEKLFHQTGYTNAILDYQLVKKILYVTIPLLIVYIVIIRTTIPISFYETEPSYEGDIIAGTINGPVLILLAVSTGAFFRNMTQIVKKDFRFYFAKGCCKIISVKEDDLEKMKYLLLLLNSYDMYLKRRIKVGIDEKRIYSIILYKNAEERSQIINSICDSLEGDKLSLANYLSSIHKVPESEFYIQETFLQQLKPVGVILATAIPIIISAVALLQVFL
jgi:hypothetical protein